MEGFIFVPGINYDTNCGPDFWIFIEVIIPKCDIIMYLPMDLQNIGLFLKKSTNPNKIDN